MILTGVLAKHYLGVGAGVVKQVFGVGGGVACVVRAICDVGGFLPDQSWGYSKCYLSVRWAVGEGSSLKKV